MAVHIVRATPSDVALIQRVANVTWPVAFREILSPEQIRYMMSWMYDTASLIEQMTQGGHVFLLAMDESEAVGFASYQVDHPEPGMTKVHKIYVLLDRQGGGVGRQLLDHVCACARDRRQRVVTLNVNRFNRAVKFYERYGFRTVRSEDVDIGGGFFMNDFVMELGVGAGE